MTIRKPKIIPKKDKDRGLEDFKFMSMCLESSWRKVAWGYYGWDRVDHMLHGMIMAAQDMPQFEQLWADLIFLSKLVTTQRRRPEGDLPDVYEQWRNDDENDS